MHGVEKMNYILFGGRDTHTQKQTHKQTTTTKNRIELEHRTGLNVMYLSMSFSLLRQGTVKERRHKTPFLLYH